MLNSCSSQTNGELAFPWTNEDLAKSIPPFLLPCKIPYFVDCKFKTDFTAKSQLLSIGCSLTRERKQNKSPKVSTFAHARASAYGNE